MTQEFARHGSDPTEVGGMAVAAVEALVMPAELSRSNPPRWLRSDEVSYREVMLFEGHVEHAGLPSDLHFGVRQELHRDLSAAHAAMPYSEAERRLILDLRSGMLPQFVRRIGTVTIMDGGIETQVSGRELMKRWYLWRRGLEQFEGQDGPALARVALHRFAARLSPWLPDPSRFDRSPKRT